MLWAAGWLCSRRSGLQTLQIPCNAEAAVAESACFVGPLVTALGCCTRFGEVWALCKQEQ
jgi:hypothetical protein